jgi:Domain of unknown function (DUF4249)
MKAINKIISGLSAVVLFASCTKVIDIDIKDVDKKIVIEAEIGNHAKECVVKLSRTVNYSTTNVFPAVNGASVNIADDKGNNYTLTEVNNSGTYTNDTVVGTPGNVYTLKVVADGKTFTSTCKMGLPIAIDSMNNETLFLLGNNVKIVRTFFGDDGNSANYYRYFKSVNGLRKGESEVTNDDFINGVKDAPINYASRGPNDTDSLEFTTGNVFGVTLQNVQRAVYIYFNSKSQNTNGQSGAPANPETNIIGGALGYFSAFTSDYKTTIMK